MNIDIYKKKGLYICDVFEKTKDNKPAIKLDLEVLTYLHIEDLIKWQKEYEKSKNVL